MNMMNKLFEAYKAGVVEMASWDTNLTDLKLTDKEISDSFQEYLNRKEKEKLRPLDLDTLKKVLGDFCEWHSVYLGLEFSRWFEENKEKIEEELE